MVDRIEYRVTELPGWVTRTPPSGNPVYEGWMRFADGREPDLLSLPLFVDAVAPAALELGLRRMTTVELTVYLRARPAPGWLAFRTLTRYLADGYFEEDAELWDSAGQPGGAVPAARPGPALRSPALSRTGARCPGRPPGSWPAGRKVAAAPCPSGIISAEAVNAQSWRWA